MRHRVKKIKFKGGRDATRMLVRQLLKSFIVEGKMTSSPTKIAVLRSQIEILVHKAKNNTEADRNYILKSLSDKKTITILQKNIAPNFKDRVGGYVRMTKLSKRSLDGKPLARLEWVTPVIIEEKKEEKKTSVPVKTKKMPVKSRVVSKKTK